MFTSLNVVRMALLACDCSRRSATRARRRDIGTRCSGRSPSGHQVTAPGCGTMPAQPAAGAAATRPVSAPGLRATASDLVTRPPRPVPGTSAAATPFSSRILRAAGMRRRRGRGCGGSRCAAAAGRCGLDCGCRCGDGAGLGRGVDAGNHLTRDDRIAITLDDFDQHAASGAGSSRTTLSVSMSIRFSSRETASPAFLCQKRASLRRRTRTAAEL
jgi:hypothetical protein